MPKLPPGLRETLLIAALAALYFVGLNWVASCRCLGTVSDSLADIQDRTLDFVTRLEYRRSGPERSLGAPIRLIQIDEATMQTHSPGSYIFSRAKLADLILEFDRQNPKAVFIDLDLSNPSNEPKAGPQLSKGDQKLLSVLQQKRAYPILLPASRAPIQLLGQAAAGLGLEQICFVSPIAIRDGDLRVRRIPRHQESRPYPAMEAISLIAKDQPCPQNPIANIPDAVVNSDLTTRMVFRELELWKGLLPLKAGSVLEGTTPGLLGGSLVLVGRTDPASLDYYPTPVGLLAGVAIHANELLTLQTYGRNVQLVSPWVGVPLAFGATLLVLLFTPLLSRLLSGFFERMLARLRRRKPNLEPAKANFLERPLMWTMLFATSAILLHQSGLFMDYFFPILGLELGRVTKDRKLYSLFSRVFKWALRN